MASAPLASIYALTDPETGRVRYVGQTSRVLSARLYRPSFGIARKTVSVAA